MLIARGVICQFCHFALGGVWRSQRHWGQRVARKVSVRDVQDYHYRNRRGRSCVVLELPIWDHLGNTIWDNCLHSIARPSVQHHDI